MLADGRAPLFSQPSVRARHVETPLACPRHRGRQGQAPGVQRDERQFQSLALAQKDILFGDFNILKFYQAVLYGVQAHEFTAIGDLKTRRLRLDYERGYLLSFLPADDFGGGKRHDDDDVGYVAVGAP